METILDVYSSHLTILFCQRKKMPQKKETAKYDTGQKCKQ